MTFDGVTAPGLQEERKRKKQNKTNDYLPEGKDKAQFSQFPLYTGSREHHSLSWSAFVHEL